MRSIPSQPRCDEPQGPVERSDGPTPAPSETERRDVVRTNNRGYRRPVVVGVIGAGPPPTGQSPMRRRRGVPHVVGTDQHHPRRASIAGRWPAGSRKSHRFGDAAAPGNLADLAAEADRPATVSSATNCRGGRWRTEQHREVGAGFDGATPPATLAYTSESPIGIWPDAAAREQHREPVAVDRHATAGHGAGVSTTSA